MIRLDLLFAGSTFRQSRRPPLFSSTRHICTISTTTRRTSATTSSRALQRWRCARSTPKRPAGVELLPAHAPSCAPAAPAHPPSRPASSATLGSLPPWRPWQIPLSTRDPAPLRARWPRTFSSRGHHPARDGPALLSHGRHGQPLRRCSSSSRSIFDDELNRRCADPFPLLAWHDMTMSSLCPMPPLRPRPWPHSRPPADPPGADLAAAWAAAGVAGCNLCLLFELGTLGVIISG